MTSCRAELALDFPDCEGLRPPDGADFRVFLIGGLPDCLVCGKVYDPESCVHPTVDGVIPRACAENLGATLADEWGVTGTEIALMRWPECQKCGRHFDPEKLYSYQKRAGAGMLCSEHRWLSAKHIRSARRLHQQVLDGPHRRGLSLERAAHEILDSRFFGGSDANPWKNRRISRNRLRSRWPWRTDGMLFALRQRAESGEVAAVADAAIVEQACRLAMLDAW